MTAEEVFCDLSDKYGEEFNWHMLPFSNKFFVNELKKEIGSEHFLYNEDIWAAAKCDSNDDVLYVTGSEDGKECYYIFHLTYAENNANGFPRYIKFIGIEDVKEYIEKCIEKY